MESFFGVGRDAPFLLVLASALLSGCWHNKDATIEGGGVLAVDAYATLDMVDGCSGGKLDLCTDEHIVDVTDVSMSEPGLLEVLPLDQAPAELTALGTFKGLRLLHGLAPGKTSLCLTALFDDDSKRNDCTEVTVGVVDRVDIGYGCNPSGTVDEVASPEIPPGSSLVFGASLYAGDLPLGGVLGEVLDESGIRRLDWNTYAWTAPAEGGTITIRSPLDPSLASTIVTFGADEVTGLHVETNYVRPLVFEAGAVAYLDVAEDVNGHRACRDGPVWVRSETPDVCRGPAGETTWDGPSFSAVSEGTCRLSFGAVGRDDTLATFEEFVFVVDPTDRARNEQVGFDCTTEGDRACEEYRHSMLVCKKSGGALHWLEEPCKDSICDYSAPADECPNGSCVACR